MCDLIFSLQCLYPKIKRFLEGPTSLASWRATPTWRHQQDVFYLHDKRSKVLGTWDVLSYGKSSQKGEEIFQIPDFTHFMSTTTTSACTIHGDKSSRFSHVHLKNYLKCILASYGPTFENCRTEIYRSYKKILGDIYICSSIGRSMSTMAVKIGFMFVL